jgi:hypothetical protein
MKILVQPNATVAWEQFQAMPAKSIALDGFVKGSPRKSATHLNFNHHEDVDRISTRCTASQVLVAIKGGLQPWLAGEEPIAYVNDCDQDVCLSTWLLKNRNFFEDTRSEPLISRLCWAVDMLDTFAGAYPLNPADELYEQICWVFADYTTARQNGTLSSLDAQGMLNIIESVHSRIDRYRIGKAERRKADTRYQVLGRNKDCALVVEEGIDARTAMRRDGINGFLSLREHNGKRILSVGKLQPMSPFPVLEILDAFNRAEGIGPTDIDRYGGSDSIGGSPRKRGCSLDNNQLLEIVTKTCGA